MKEMTIKRATILDAPLEALHELILLPNPATEPKVVSGEGVDQHLATIHLMLNHSPNLLQTLLLANSVELLGWN